MGELEALQASSRLDEPICEAMKAETVAHRGFRGFGRMPERAVRADERPQSPFEGNASTFLLARDRPPSDRAVSFGGCESSDRFNILALLTTLGRQWLTSARFQWG